MTTITPEARALLKSGRYQERIVIKAEFIEGDVGVWNGSYFPMIDGLDYQILSKFTLSDLEQSLDGAVNGLTLTFHPQDETIQNIIEQYSWRQSPITVDKYIFPPNTEKVEDVALVMRHFSGRIEEIIVTDPPQGRGATVSVKCATAEAELDKQAGLYRRNSSSLEGRFTSDTFFSRVADATKILTPGVKD